MRGWVFSCIVHGWETSSVKRCCPWGALKAQWHSDPCQSNDLWPDRWGTAKIESSGERTGRVVLLFKKRCGIEWSHWYCFNPRNLQQDPLNWTLNLTPSLDSTMLQAPELLKRFTVAESPAKVGKLRCGWVRRVPESSWIPICTVSLQIS